MAIRHAISGEPIDVRPLGPRLTESASVALFKSDDLELIRLVLPRGKSLPVHRVDGAVTIQCIEGQVEVAADGHRAALGAGQLLFLAGGVAHGVTALADSSALLTIVLHR